MASGSLIDSVTAREVFSERGHPGIETTVTTRNGSTGVAMVTAGVSVGKHEVQFAYDGGERWGGLGVRKAVGNVQDVIAPALKGMNASRQREIDGALLDLDGTPTKSKLGGNATAMSELLADVFDARRPEAPLRRERVSYDGPRGPEASYAWLDEGGGAALRAVAVRSRRQRTQRPIRSSVLLGSLLPGRRPWSSVDRRSA